MHPSTDEQKKQIYDQPKMGSFPRPVGGSEKLGTLSGVFVPTSLNVLSILMFIRFGFILGQGGVIGVMGMMAVAYLINLVTTMSISAIASNGTVRGGGAYYLISRSLGPEFGGSIGIVFYVGFVFSTGMNAVGLIDCLMYNFGADSGNWSHSLPEGFWWQYLWATIVLVLCTAICLAGSGIFARFSNGLLAILLLATFSIPLSAFVVKPYHDPVQHIDFTGLSLKTLKENLLPNFTKHAAGSQLKGRENFPDLFGVLFPATGGIFAGASMSGDLKTPSKSIPKGTLYGLALTFIGYTLVILAMAASVTRVSLYKNLNVIQDTNISGVLILLGEFATSFFSALMGVIGPAKLLQAIARDSLLPGLSLFGQGTKKGDEPTYAIIVTYIFAQLTMLFDVNRIASFITMAYLMTFLVTNLACFLLKISSAPNFRPSFRYFNWWTAAAGAIACATVMFLVDGIAASGAVGILVVIFLLIHYTTPPKSWGDVSQSLIYHQVRKYLLRLKHEHVKFWRPQILLFVNDPRRGYKLIQFCNSLKKGALFILGHVIVTSNFGASVPEARRQQAAWTKYIDLSKIKAFVNVAISPSIEWGARNIVLSAGLGGMRPNIVVMGFYNLKQFRQEQPLVDVPSPPPERKIRKHDPPNGAMRQRRRSVATKQLEGTLPTDSCYIEKGTDVQSYVMVLEDMLLKLQINVAVATGFNDLELPNPKEGNSKKYIDLWPIQMSATISSQGQETQQDVLTTNFDTYTLILQLGCILNTVPSWKKSFSLRVAVFVEYESDVEEERARVATLLENLRIRAEILVFWLASGDVKSYQLVVNGDSSSADAEVEEQVEKVLEDEEWWSDLKRLRGKISGGELTASESLAVAEELSGAAPAWPSASFQHGKRENSITRFEGLKQLLYDSRKRPSIANLSNLGVSMGMRTHRLDDDLISRHASHASASEDSEWSDEESFASDSALEGSDEEDSTDISRSESESEQISFRTAPAAASSPSVSKTQSKRSSLASSRKSRSPKKRSLRHAAHEAAPEVSGIPPNLPREDFNSTLIEVTSPRSPSPKQGSDLHRGRTSTAQRDLKIDGTDRIRHPSRRSPGARFSSSPVPVSKVASEEGAGPSIMFAEEPRPSRQAPDTTTATPIPNYGATTCTSDTPQKSIYQRPHASQSPPKPSNTTTIAANGAAKTATGPTATSSASIPLSFNDLPCRAQHLILNELITSQSEDTAVIFTTLPAPVEGTYKSEVESLAYVSDLEVLCGGLPPTLMVHSNSMTVTMNL
jgi:solute carrier family 12 (potassium/chloride transporters), member 9